MSMFDGKEPDMYTGKQEKQYRLQDIFNVDELKKKLKEIVNGMIEEMNDNEHFET